MMQKQGAESNYPLGVCYKIANSLLFVLITLLISRGSLKVHVCQLFFIIASCATVIAFIALKLSRQRVVISLKKEALKFYIGRAVISFITSVSWVYAIGNLGFSEATALGYTTTFWLTLMVPAFCGEKIRKSSLIVLLSNTIGILLILNFDVTKLTWNGLGVALFTTFLWASYDIMCKKQTKSEHYLLQAFFVYLIAAIISAPIAAFVWQPISIESLSWTALVSLFAVLNLVVLFLAYSYAPIIIVMPFGYFRLLFAITFSYLLHDIVPYWGCMLGAAIIVISDLIFYLLNVRNMNISSAVSIPVNLSTDELSQISEETVQRAK